MQIKQFPTNGRETVLSFKDAEGTLHAMRDVLHISSFLLTDACEQLTEVVLNQAVLLASALVHPLSQLLAGTSDAPFICCEKGTFPTMV